MAVGNSPGVGALNVLLGNVAVGVRDWAEEVDALWSYVVSLGATEADQVAALAAMTGWQDSSTDPQAFWTTANYAFAVAQLYYGQITQGSVFDYDSALANARGAS